MNNHDWSTFVKRISIRAEANKLINSFLIQEKLEEWFLSQAHFFTSEGNKLDKSEKIYAGLKYSWMWYGSDNVAEGEILETNHLDFVKFTFLGCVVTVRIKSEANENLIELIQSGIPLDEDSRMSYYVGCTRGWTFYLANLKSMLEGGLDLRNRNKQLSSVLNT